MGSYRQRSIDMPLLLAVLVVALMAVVGCARGGGGDEATAPETVDSALQSAAAAIEPALREEFPGVFAGLVLDHDRHVLVVYRIGDVAIEARARELAGEVAVEFRDGAYSLVQMQEVVDRITMDIEYWRGQGIEVSGAGPEADGSGVAVYVTEASAAVTERIRERYAEMAVSVQERTIVVPTGPPLDPIPAPSGGFESKQEADR